MTHSNVYDGSCATDDIHATQTVYNLWSRGMYFTQPDYVIFEVEDIIYYFSWSVLQYSSTSYDTAGWILDSRRYTFYDINDKSYLIRHRTRRYWFKKKKKSQQRKNTQGDLRDEFYVIDNTFYDTINLTYRYRHKLYTGDDKFFQNKQSPVGWTC